MSLLMTETSAKQVIIDIETDGLLDKVTKIHCIVCKEVLSGVVTKYTSTDDFLNGPYTGDTILIGHNILSFDLPVLAKLLGYRHSVSKCIDTLILSQLFNPIREDGHSLSAWGERLEFPKKESPTFEKYTPKLLEYCVNDVELTYRLFKYLTDEDDGFKFSKGSIKREHYFRYIINQQEYYGFYLDLPYATTFLAELTDKCITIEHELQKIFPPTVIELKTKTKYIPFNPASRKQIAERLMLKGWKPELLTEKGNIIVNEDVLAEIKNIPESESILEYLLLQKRASQVRSWIKFCDPNTSRVYGRVKTLGTVSTRCSHLDPNVAQTPAVHSPYGSECRTCWTVSDVDKYRLLGCDASQLELRVLAHYMKDKNYIEEILHGDIHSANQRMAGLKTRDQAKVFIYALIYGAGARKIGKIMNKSPREGQHIKNKFLENVPALDTLLQKVHNAADHSGTIRGLDGRYFQVRSLHSSLNVLIQGGGAIICKEWLIQIMKEIQQQNIKAKPVANIHDEIQFEVNKEEAETLGQITKQAMKRVEKILKLDCPLDSEYKIGRTWALTH